MKLGATLFLRGVLVLVGMGALGLLLWEPHLEGRNAGATLYRIYFQDPFLAYAYVAAIPFFLGLYQGFKVLGYAGRNREFTPPAVRSVRIIRNCALAIIGFVAAGEVIIVLGDSDDHAGGVAIGACIIFASLVIAAATSVLERTLQSGVERSEGP